MDDTADASVLPVDFEGSLDPVRLPEVTFGNHSLMATCDPGSPMVTKSNSGRMSPVRSRTMKEYDQQISDLKKENFSLKMRIYYMEERMQQRYGDGQDVFKTNIELQVEIENLKRDLIDKQVLVQKAAVAMKTLTDNHEQAVETMKNRVLTEHREEMNHLKEQAELAIKDCEKYRKESEDSAKKCEALKQSLDEMTSDRNDANRAKEELKNKVKNAEFDVQTLTAQLKLSEQTRSDQEKERSTLLQRQRELEHQLQDARKQSDRKDRDIGDELEDQKEAVRRKDAKIKDMEELLKHKDDVLKKLEDALKDMENLKNKAENDLEQTTGDLEKKSSVLDRYKISVEGLVRAVRDKEKECKNNIKKVEEAKQEVSSLREALRAAELEKTKAVSSLSSQLTESEASNKRMEVQLNEANTLSENLIMSLGKKEGELAGFQDQLRKAMDALNKSEEAVEALQAQLKAERADFENQLSEQALNYKMALNNKPDSKTEVEELRKQIADLQKEIVDLQKLIASQTAELLAFTRDKTDIGQLSEKLKARERDIQDMSDQHKQDIAALSKELENLRAENKGHDERIHRPNMYYSSQSPHRQKPWEGGHVHETIHTTYNTYETTNLTKVDVPLDLVQDMKTVMESLRKEFSKLSGLQRTPDMSNKWDGSNSEVLNEGLSSVQKIYKQLEEGVEKNNQLHQILLSRLSRDSRQSDSPDSNSCQDGGYNLGSTEHQSISKAAPSFHHENPPKSGLANGVGSNTSTISSAPASPLSSQSVGVETCPDVMDRSLQTGMSFYHTDQWVQTSPRINRGDPRYNELMDLSVSSLRGQHQDLSVNICPTVDIDSHYASLPARYNTTNTGRLVQGTEPESNPVLVNTKQPGRRHPSQLGQDNNALNGPDRFSTPAQFSSTLSHLRNTSQLGEDNTSFSGHNRSSLPAHPSSSPSAHHNYRLSEQNSASSLAGHPNTSLLSHNKTSLSGHPNASMSGHGRVSLKGHDNTSLTDDNRENTDSLEDYHDFRQGACFEDDQFESRHIDRASSFQLDSSSYKNTDRRTNGYNLSKSPAVQDRQPQPLASSRVLSDHSVVDGYFASGDGGHIDAASDGDEPDGNSYCHAPGQLDALERDIIHHMTNGGNYGIQKNVSGDGLNKSEITLSFSQDCLGGAGDFGYAADKSGVVPISTQSRQDKSKSTDGGRHSSDGHHLDLSESEKGHFFWDDDVLEHETDGSSEHRNRRNSWAEELQRYKVYEGKSKINPAEINYSISDLRHAVMEMSVRELRDLVIHLQMEIRDVGKGDKVLQANTNAAEAAEDGQSNNGNKMCVPRLAGEMHTCPDSTTNSTESLVTSSTELGPDHSQHKDLRQSLGNLTSNVSKLRLEDDLLVSRAQIQELEDKLEATENTVRVLSKKNKSYLKVLEAAGLSSKILSRSNSENCLVDGAQQPSRVRAVSVGELFEHDNGDSSYATSDYFTTEVEQHADKRSGQPGPISSRLKQTVNVRRAEMSSPDDPAEQPRSAYTSGHNLLMNMTRGSNATIMTTLSLTDNSTFPNLTHVALEKDNLEMHHSKISNYAADNHGRKSQLADVSEARPMSVNMDQTSPVQINKVLTTQNTAVGQHSAVVVLRTPRKESSSYMGSTIDMESPSEKGSPSGKGSHSGHGSPSGKRSPSGDGSPPSKGSPSVNLSISDKVSYCGNGSPSGKGSHSGNGSPSGKGSPSGDGSPPSKWSPSGNLSLSDKGSGKVSYSGNGPPPDKESPENSENMDRADVTMMDQSLCPDISYTSMLDNTIMSRPLSSLNMTTIKEDGSDTEGLNVEQLKVRIEHLEQVNLTLREEVSLFEALQRSTGTQVSFSLTENLSTPRPESEGDLLRQHLVEIRKLRQRLERLDVTNNPEQLLIFQTHMNQRIARQDAFISQLQQKMVDREAQWQRELAETQHRLIREKALLVEKLEQTISQLQKSLLSQRSTIDQQEVIINGFKNELEQMTENERKKDEELKRNQSEKAALEEDLMKREREFLDLEKSMFKLELAKENAESDLKRLRADMEQCEVKYQTLNQEVEEYKESSKCLKEVIIKREKTLQEKVLVVKKLATEKINVDHKLTERDAQIKRLEAELETLRQDMLSKGSAHASEVEKLKMKLEDAEHLMTQTEMEHDAELKRMNEDKMRLMARVEADMEQDRRNFNHQMDILRQEKLGLEDQVSSLKGKIMSMSGLQDEVGRLNFLLDNKTKSENELRERVKAMGPVQAEVSRLTEVLGKSQDDLMQLQKEKVRVEESLKEREEKVKKRDKQLHHLLGQHKKLDLAFVKMKNTAKERQELILSLRRRMHLCEVTLNCSSQEEKEDIMKQLLSELLATQRQVEDLLSKLEHKRAATPAEGVLVDATYSSSSTISISTTTTSTASTTAPASPLYSRSDHGGAHDDAEAYGELDLPVYDDYKLDQHSSALTAQINRSPNHRAQTGSGPLGHSPSQLKYFVDSGLPFSSERVPQSLISSDIRSLFAVLKLDVHEKLRKEISESLVTLSGMDARLTDRLRTYKAKPVAEVGQSVDYSTMREVSMACHNLRVCLDEANRLVATAWITELPPVDALGHFYDPLLAVQNDNLKHELSMTRSRLEQLNQTAKDQQSRMNTSSERHKGWETSLYKQLTKTTKDLEAAKENIDLSLATLPHSPQKHQSFRHQQSPQKSPFKRLEDTI
ncbi:unnamed protein product [Lymnaea stagnalis]|uniref:Centrosomin N-terminal motif 1 domain-containing protein n=1 Tax=Lymnaea stagnalis TaxID=6523 RepID=A0AAV2IGS4_LYMST